MHIRGLARACILLLALHFHVTGSVPVAPRDSIILQRYLAHARALHLVNEPLARRVVETARFFLGTPYLAGTLDVGAPERLIVNLSGMDCVTLVDNVLALALLDTHDAREAPPRFLANLLRVRYRDGRVDGYTSRLHYSTDWLFEMRRQGILRDVTPSFPGQPLVNPVSYLSRHHRDTLLRARLAAIEAGINARRPPYLPTRDVDSLPGQVLPGDIVLVTTTRDGLDTSHLGIAVEHDGKIHLLHASSDARVVTITPRPLPSYLRSVPRHAGIVIGRVHAPLGEPGKKYYLRTRQ